RERVLAAHAHTHETHEPLSIEYRLIARDGRVIWLLDEGVIVLDDHGQPLYLQGYLLDITREREAELQLRQQALYDPLTGLANRAFFHERLRHAIKLRHEEGQATGLLYIDLETSRGSTTAGGTISATRCSRRSAGGSSSRSGQATLRLAWEATSSPS